MLAGLEHGAVSSEAEFWNLTAGEFDFRLAAARRRCFHDEYVRRASWRAVRGFLGQAPAMKTDDQMAEMVLAMHRALGGTVPDRGGEGNRG